MDGALEAHDLEAEDFHPMDLVVKHDRQVDQYERTSQVSQDGSQEGCTVWLDMGPGYGHLVQSVDIVVAAFVIHDYLRKAYTTCLGSEGQQQLTKLQVLPLAFFIIQVQFIAWVVRRRMSCLLGFSESPEISVLCQGYEPTSEEEEMQKTRGVLVFLDVIRMHTKKQGRH